MDMRRFVLLPALGVLVACGGLGSPPDRPPPRAEPAGEQRYEATAIVLESEEHGPMLCVGMILDSLPIQCGDIPISNWSWEEVPGEEALSGTTWGRYHLVGTYDGETFSVIETGPPQPQPPDGGDPIDTPCPEPEGGWVAADPGRTTEADRQAATKAAGAEPDFAGLWVDYVDDFDPNATEDPGTEGMILNVAFTGDIDRHTAELRQVWGGPLCVVQHTRTEAELHRIQKDLEPSADEIGIQVLWSSTAVVDNVIEVGVVAIDPQTRLELDQRYGEGAVRVFPALHPVP
jgi:hypothetical protein